GLDGALGGVAVGRSAPRRRETREALPNDVRGDDREPSPPRQLGGERRLAARGGTGDRDRDRPPRPPAKPLRELEQARHALGLPGGAGTVLGGGDRRDLRAHER